MPDLKQRPGVPLRHVNEEEHRRMLAERANKGLPMDGTHVMQAPLQLESVNVADLPSAADWEGALVWVPDDGGGATVAVSDGTDWRRVGDSSTIS